MTYFRSNIEAMKGYTPGEQPKVKRLVKLNTNENPFPVSPKAMKALQEFAGDLRRYPDPVASGVRKAAAAFVGLQEENIIAGNGSDDILTIVMRAFVGEGDKVAFPEPSYSLYPVLADIQGGSQVSIPLTEEFQLPENTVELLKGCKVFFVPNPNAPTGNLFDKAMLRKICAEFDGIVLVDEAYADFAAENCIDLIGEFDNVIVSRTLSKSFSLAGARLGFAASTTELIDGMMKVKDSYNINMLTQVVGEASLLDLDYMYECRDKIIATRAKTTEALKALGMNVLDSQSNFLFVEPIVIGAKEYFDKLREHNIITRYFPAETTKKYVRITIGTDEEMNEFVEVTKSIIS